MNKFKILFLTVRILQVMVFLLLLNHIIGAIVPFWFRQTPDNLFKAIQMTIFSVMIFLIIQWILRVIRNIKSENSISTINEVYLKRTGILTLFIPFIKLVFDMIDLASNDNLQSNLFYETFNHYYFYPEKVHLWILFFIGILLYGLGMAIGEALKLKEENELTI